MTHPLEQLAPYVDGSLTGPERLEVERHLASCAQCRSEVAIATEARAALRSMPEVEVPTDLGVPALEAMEAREAHHPGPRAGCAAMPFVAAAAVVALLAITLPRIGRRDGGGRQRRGRRRSRGPRRPRPAVGGRLHRFRRRLAPSRSAGLGGAICADAASEPQERRRRCRLPDRRRRRRREPARSSEALRCLRTAFEGFPGDPVRLVEASFEGTPAYLAFVLEGPGADQPADQMTVWVAARDDCSIVSLTSVRL